MLGLLAIVRVLLYCCCCCCCCCCWFPLVDCHDHRSPHPHHTSPTATPHGESGGAGMGEDLEFDAGRSARSRSGLHHGGSDGGDRIRRSDTLPAVRDMPSSPRVPEHAGKRDTASGATSGHGGRALRSVSVVSARSSSGDTHGVPDRHTSVHSIDALQVGACSWNAARVSVCVCMCVCLYVQGVHARRVGSYACMCVCDAS